MRKNLLLLFVGLLLGVIATTYFLGMPRSRRLAGVPIKPPERSGNTSGTVAVTIDEKFFASLLGTIFQQLGPPQLRLSQNQPQESLQPIAFQNSCNNVLVLNPEGDNVKTSVRFTGGKITTPLAFTGSYNVIGKCVQFKGTSTAVVNLSFDQAKQTVLGQLDVDEVSLNNVPVIVTTLITAFVRKTIDERLNPFTVLQASQLNLSLPVAATGGSLKARVEDVRAEVQEGTLKLYVTYDFSAERGKIN